MNERASGLLGSLFNLSSFVLWPTHLLCPPLGSHGVELSKKMLLKLRAHCTAETPYHVRLPWTPSRTSCLINRTSRDLRGHICNMEH